MKQKATVHFENLRNAFHSCDLNWEIILSISVRFWILGSSACFNTPVQKGSDDDNDNDSNNNNNNNNNNHNHNNNNHHNHNNNNHHNHNNNISNNNSNININININNKQFFFIKHVSTQ